MSDTQRHLFSLFHLGVSIHNLNLQSERRLGLSLGQWCLLKQLIDMPATSAQNLARSLGVHPSTLTQALKRLESREAIFITEDPKDSRKKLISITRAGKLALDKADLVLGKQAQELNQIGDELAKVQIQVRNQIAEL